MGAYHPREPGQYTCTPALVSLHICSITFIFNAMNKETIYLQNIQRSLVEIYTHMADNLLAWLPEDAEFDRDNITIDQQASILAVEAIEQEWMLDEQDRKENSLIQWCEEET